LFGVFGLVTSGAAWAGTEYFIQIGALKHPQASFAHKASGFGEVRAVKIRSGITRYQVGPFPSRIEAEGRLRDVRAAGYPDAFVRRGGEQATREGVRPKAAPGNQAALLAGLPATARARLIYIDGSLHVREEGRFIPVEEYTP